MTISILIIYSTRGFNIKLNMGHTENLSKKPTTVLSQSSTYGMGNASYANDGNLNTTESDCAHTAHNQSKAWFQVDLGKPHGIQHVKIYYRREGDGAIDWKQYRFRKFYLDVSNSSASGSMTSQRARCFTDNTKEPTLPPNIIDIPCEQWARYVIVESTYKAPEDNRSTGPILEICEIEVYGCNLRHYGLDCSKKCSENCIKEICNTTNGSCTFGCKGGFYGNLCNESCSISCPSGCNRYTGYCDGICPVTYFGHFCEKICNSNCLGGCNRETGLCDFGCIDGKFGELCNETCSIGCNSICEQENENCSCKADWKGDNCDEESRNRLNSHLETFVGVGLGVVSSILIVVGIVYCILRMITRKRRSSKQQRNHSNKDMVIYENINETTNFDKRDDIQECVYWNQFSPNKSARNNDEISISRDSNVVNHGIYVNDTNQNSESKISTRVCGEGINTNTLVVDEEDAYMAIRGFDQEETMYEELKIT